MTDLRAGAQQALEALENAVRYHGIMLMADPPQDAWKYHRVEDNAKQAITSLREALEQQPEQEQQARVGKDPRCPCQDGDACHYKDCKGTKAWPVPQAEPVSCRFCHDARGCWTWQCYNCGEIDDVQKPTPPAAQQAEPLEYWNAVEGWVKIDEVREHFDSVGCGTIYKTAGEDRVPLYTAPPKREWQGLTDEEIWSADPRIGTSDSNVNPYQILINARAIEATLKRKNYD